MAWKIVRITIEMEDVGKGRVAPTQAKMVLEGKDLTKYIGIGWGKITEGFHHGKHIFDPSIFAPPGTKFLGKNLPGQETLRLKEPNCGVKDWP